MDTVTLRDTQIANDLNAAQAAREHADREEAAWRERENANRAEAHALVAKAKAEAAVASEKNLSAAQARIDETIAAAEAKIGKARDAALAEIEGVASEAAQDIVQRLAGVNVSASAATSAVKKALNNG